jgi:hypothetical protein
VLVEPFLGVLAPAAHGAAVEGDGLRLFDEHHGTSLADWAGGVSQKVTRGQGGGVGKVQGPKSQAGAMPIGGALP